MSRQRVLMVFPYAPSYREPIYELMDKEFDCKFCFCKQTYIKLKYMDCLEIVTKTWKRSYYIETGYILGISLRLI